MHPLLSSLFVSVLLCSLNFSQARAQDALELSEGAAGKIVRVIGSDEVTVTNGLKGTSRKLKADGIVYGGDKIITLEAQTVVLELVEKSELIIAPSSSFWVETYERVPQQKTILKLFYGALRSLVRKAYGEKEQFVVKTPNAVMGVRGTEFVVTSDSVTGDSQVDTLQGTVAVASSIEQLHDAKLSVAVHAGLSSRIRKNERAPSPPKAYDVQLYRNQMKQRFRGAFDHAGSGQHSGMMPGFDNNRRDGNGEGKDGHNRRRHRQDSFGNGPGGNGNGDRADNQGERHRHRGMRDRPMNPLNRPGTGLNNPLPLPGQNLPKPAQRPGPGAGGDRPHLPRTPPPGPGGLPITHGQ